MRRPPPPRRSPEPTARGRFTRNHTASPSSRSCYIGSGLSRLHDLVRGGAQFFIATHSPILLAYPGATIYAFGGHAPRTVRYEDTEHFRVTHDFLSRYPAMLRVLLGDRDELT